MVTSAAPAIFAGRFIFYVFGAHSADVLLQRRVFLLLFPESVLVLWWDGLFYRRSGYLYSTGSLCRHHDLADDESAFRGCFFQDLKPAFLISEKIRAA